MPKKRSAYHHGDLRQGLLVQAIKLVGERAGTHFTMRELALKLGVSHSAAYRHFKDKGELLSALAVEGFVRLGDFQLQNLSPKLTPVKRVQQLGANYVRFALAFPWHFRVMFSSELSDPEKHPALTEVGRAGFQPVVDAVIKCQAAGDFKAGDPNKMATLLWATVHGLAVLLIDKQIGFAPNGDSYQPEDLTETLTTSVVRGFLKNG